jgi:hypothetical protein
LFGGAEQVDEILVAAAAAGDTESHRIGRVRLDMSGDAPVQVDVLPALQRRNDVRHLGQRRDDAW